MMTPGQKKDYERVKEFPKIKLLIDRLDCVPTETKEYRRNVEISKRVDGLIDQISMAPASKRRVIKEPANPFENPDLSWVKPGECPF